MMRQYKNFKPTLLSWRKKSMQMKMSAEEAKERAKELMQQGYH